MKRKYPLCKLAIDGLRLVHVPINCETKDMLKTSELVLKLWLYTVRWESKFQISQHGKGISGVIGDLLFVCSTTDWIQHLQALHIFNNRATVLGGWHCFHEEKCCSQFIILHSCLTSPKKIFTYFWSHCWLLGSVLGSFYPDSHTTIFYLAKRQNL